MSFFVQKSGQHIIRVWLLVLLCKGPPYKQCSRGNEGMMHVLRVEVWVILKLIVLNVLLAPGWEVLLSGLQTKDYLHPSTPILASACD